MHQPVRVCHTDHTDSIIVWIACSVDFLFFFESHDSIIVYSFDFKNKNKIFQNPIRNSTLTVGYGLGMVEIKVLTFVIL